MSISYADFITALIAKDTGTDDPFVESVLLDATSAARKYLETLVDAINGTLSGSVEDGIRSYVSQPAKISGKAKLWWVTGQPGILHCLFDNGTPSGKDYIIFDGTAGDINA